MAHPAETPGTGDLIRGRASHGDFEITICTDGDYYLDGGAMFGVVPKPMWEKRSPADGQNRILLGTNSVVVRTGLHTILIETGIGNKLPEKLRAIYNAKALLPASLAAAGVKADQVDIVINTHLHFDHCGWNTRKGKNGGIIPTFPNARYFAHRGEVDHGHLQLDRDRVSYISENYDPLVASGQMTLVEGGAGTVTEIAPGISVEVFPGHTAQQLAVMIDSAGKRACYPGDLIPTTSHLDPVWVMGYDLDPVTCIAERKRFYERAIPEQWLVLFTHDHHVPMGRIVTSDKGKPVLSTSA